MQKTEDSTRQARTQPDQRESQGNHPIDATKIISSCHRRRL